MWQYQAMIDALKQPEVTGTASETERHLAQTGPIGVEFRPPFVPRPMEKSEHGAPGSSFGRNTLQPARANESEAPNRFEKPDEFAGLLPAQLHRQRPDECLRTLLAAVLEATAADLGRGGECRTEALRWIQYRRSSGDRNLGFTLAEICERLDLDVEWTRERLVAIEVDLGVASRSGRRAEAVPLCPRRSESD